MLMTVFWEGVLQTSSMREHRMAAAKARQHVLENCEMHSRCRDLLGDKFPISNEATRVSKRATLVVWLNATQRDSPPQRIHWMTV